MQRMAQPRPRQEVLDRRVVRHGAVHEIPDGPRVSVEPVEALDALCDISDQWLHPGVPTRGARRQTKAPGSPGGLRSVASSRVTQKSMSPPMPPPPGIG